MYSFFSHTTQISAQDNLPSIICDKCVHRLNLCNDFIKLAKASETSLKAFIGKVGADFQEFTKTIKPINENVELYEEESQPATEINEDTLDNKKNVPTNNKSKVIACFQQAFELADTLAAPTECTDPVEEDTPEEEDFELFTETNDSNKKRKSEEQLEVAEEVELANVDMVIDSAEQDDVYMSTIDVHEFTVANVPGTNTSKYGCEIDLFDEEVMDETLNQDPISVAIKPKTTTSTVPSEESDENEREFETITTSVKVKSKRLSKTAVANNTAARFFCDKCQRDFSSRQNLNRHMNSHEGKKPFVCKECGKSFSQNGSLKQHYYTHTGERPYKCTICDRGFTQWKTLSFHLRRHTGEKPFSCEYCGISFRQKDGLKHHLMKMHLKTLNCGDKQTHVCSICHEALTTKELLDGHMKRHLNMHKNVATAAISTDSQSEYLVEYLHDDEFALLEKDNADDVGNIMESITHVVDVNGTSAADPDRAKKYQCRICFKCFAFKKSLVRHLSIHKLNILNCLQCNLLFDSSYALKLHLMREHKEQNINLNDCEECHLSFEDESQHDDHLRSSHGLVCHECPKMLFKTRNDLLEHQVDHEDILN